jgi:hypothetical protein
MHKPLPAHPNVRRCTHIKVNGQRCGSPSLRREFFCYFHTLVIKGVQQRVDRQLGAIAMLEDRESVQLSIMLVVDGLVKGTLDPIRGRLILQALRLAARNVQHLRFGTPFEADKQTMVREVPNYARQYLIEHPEYGPTLSDRGEGEAEASKCGAGAPAREATTKSGLQLEAQAKPQATKQTAAEKIEADKREAEKSEAEKSAAAKSQAADSARDPAAKRRKSAAHGASRGTKPEKDPAPEERKKPTSEPGTPKEYKRVKQAQTAIPGALAGNWRDLKTVFEFAGICQQNKEAT